MKEAFYAVKVYDGQTWQRLDISKCQQVTPTNLAQLLQKLIPNWKELEIVKCAVSINSHGHRTVCKPSVLNLGRVIIKKTKNRQIIQSYGSLCTHVDESFKVIPYGDKKSDPKERKIPANICGFFGVPYEQRR